MTHLTVLLGTLQAVSDILARTGADLLSHDDAMIRYHEASENDPSISWVESVAHWERLCGHLREYRKTLLIDIDNLRRMGFENEMEEQGEGRPN